MRKNVSGQRIGAQLVSATDGSAFTGAVTVYITGDAGTQAVGTVGSGTCTHEGNGYHTYAPSQAETNFDLIAFTFTGTGAVPVTVQVYTRFDTNLTHVAGTAYASSGLGLLASLESGSIDSGGFSPTQSQFWASGLLLTGYSNAYKGSILKFTSGSNAGSFVVVTASSWTGSFYDLSIYPSLPATPSGGDSFVVIPGCAVADVYQWRGSSISSSLFTGITTLAQWLGLLAGKQTGNTTARTELRATGAGSGTFDETTDSLQAIRDQGDAAWTGSGDWTADEKTVIKAVLGIPVSGTTPDAPTTGVLAIIRDRIGAFTGSGVNTILGFFRALLRKDVSNPSDAGGSFDAAADSVEAISEAAAAMKAKTDQLTFSTANRVNAQVFGMEANTLTASALATDAVNEINSASNPLVLQTTTIATLASQVSFTLTAGSADNGAYNGCLAIVTDASTATQKARGVVLQYVGSTRTVRLAFDPGVFTMAAGDSISIMAANQTPVIHAEMSVKSTAGTTAQLAAWMEVAGTRVPITTIDAAATCSFVVREHGSGSNLFTKSGAASDVRNSMFEVEQASPAFTDDRQYELTATITLNSVAYSTTHSRVVIG